jgi:hypothetical protein
MGIQERAGRSRRRSIVARAAKVCRRRLRLAGVARAPAGTGSRRRSVAVQITQSPCHRLLHRLAISAGV